MLAPAGEEVMKSLAQLLDAREKAADGSPESRWLLDMRHVRTVLEEHPLGVRDARLDRSNDGRRRLVVGSAQEQGRRDDFVQSRQQRPRFQFPDDVEFARSVHDVIDETIRLERAGRREDFRRPRIEAAQMATVKDVDRCSIRGVTRGPSGFVLGEHARNIAWKLRPQAICLADPVTHVGWRIGDDDACQSRGLLERVLHREHPAPRLSEQMNVRQIERLPQHAKLFAEDFGRVEIGIRRTRGFPAADLIVKNNAATVLGQITERGKVLMRCARTAVRDEERKPAGQFALADDAIPHVETTKRKRPFSLSHGSCYVAAWQNSSHCTDVSRKDPDSMQRVVLALFILSLGAAPAVARSTAVVRGIAYIGCEARTPLRGATVVLRSGSVQRFVRTNARGEYSLVGIEPGSYEITLERAGFSVQRSVLLDPDDTARANLGVEGSTGCEPSVVRVDPPTVDRYTLR